MTTRFMSLLVLVVLVAGFTSVAMIGLNIARVLERQNAKLREIRRTLDNILHLSNRVSHATDPSRWESTAEPQTKDKADLRSAAPTGTEPFLL